MPFADNAHGVIGALFKGWQLNNITTISTGPPFTVQISGYNRSGNLNTTNFSLNERPNLKPGRSNNPILSGPDRYWDVSAFELGPENQLGNLGRNTLIGPGLAMLDVSVNKKFAIGERAAVQFRAEMFNSLNHPNFAIPSQRTVFSSSGRVNSAGRITSTSTPSRQLQFGLKLSF